jgi:predicted transcriptional regulator
MTKFIRNQWEILYTILKFFRREKEEVIKSRLIGYAGLCPRDSKKHFELLEKKGFLREKKIKRGKREITTCTITDKGLKLRDNFEHILGLFGNIFPKW